MAKIERGSDLLFDKWPQKAGTAPVSDITSAGGEQQRGEEQWGEGQRVGEQRGRMGRPKLRTEDKRTAVIGVPVSAAEMDSLREWAARRGKRLGTLAREMLLALAERDQ